MNVGSSKIRTFRRGHLALVWLVVFTLSTGTSNAWAQSRDWQSSEQRIYAQTAYSLDQWDWQINTGVFGASDEDLLLLVGATIGFGAGLQLSMNLAHFGTGLINAQVKWNMVDESIWGLGLTAGLTWGNGEWIWVLGEDYAEVLRGIDLFIIPIWLWASFPLVDWFQFDFGAGYTHAEIVGDLDEELFLDGSFGVQEVALHPVARFYIVDRLAISLGARLPLWSQSGRNFAARATLGEGVVVGIRTVGKERIPFSDRYAVTLTLQSPINRVLSIALDVTRSPTAKSVYGISVAPSLRLMARF